MDRVLARPRWRSRRLWTAGGVLTGVALSAALVLSTPSSATLRLQPERLTIATVERGTFQEYVPVIGSVEPIRTVFLDVVEGGRVDEIVAEDGRPIDRGELILRLSNAALQKEAIGTESALLENMNALRNTRINLAEKALLLKEQLLDTEYRIGQLDKQRQRYREMLEEGAQALSRAELEAVTDELEYLRGKRHIIEDRIEQERALREQQLAHVDATIERVERNLAIVADTLDSLEVRAPISGHLSALGVEPGQTVQRGENIGQIDVLDGFRVRAQVDQHYIARIEVGQQGSVRLDGRGYRLEITKIYPEVVDGLFGVDLTFVGAVPEGIKRGQSLRVDLSLSGARQALLLAKGGFYQSSGGRWVYRVAADGSGAYRRELEIGRQNPEHFEVLSGLEPGDRVIVSSYDTFGSASEIEFSEPLPAS